MYFSRLQGQGDVRLSGRERHAYRMHAGDDARVTFIDFANRGQADAGHDAHINDDVRRVRELNADAGERRTQWAHTEGQHIHRSAAHCAAEESL